MLIGLLFLAFFFVTLIGDGYTAFRQTVIALDVELPRERASLSRAEPGVT